MRKILCCLPMLLLVSAAATRPASSPTFEPTSSYEKRTLEGFTIVVHRSLLAEEKELGDRALKMIERRLADVVWVVPPAAVEKLRQIPIWLENRNPKVAHMCYHPSRRWLVEHDFNPDKANCVEIGSAARLLDLRWSERQPWALLHELAHGYYFQFLGHDNAEIKAAYQRATENKMYDAVLFWSGKRVRHYAMTNDKEFFAEMSEAYFGVNDFYPFVRAELREYDPEVYKLIEKLWGVGASK